MAEVGIGRSEQESDGAIPGPNAAVAAPNSYALGNRERGHKQQQRTETVRIGVEHGPDLPFGLARMNRAFSDGASKLEFVVGQALCCAFAAPDNIAPEFRVQKPPTIIIERFGFGLAVAIVT